MERFVLFFYLFFCVILSKAYSFSDTSDLVIPIDEVVVTGQFQPTSLYKSVYKIKVINQERIRRMSSLDLTSVLQSELGIRFSNDLVLGESNIELMGMSGQNVKVLMNGIPMVDRGGTKQSISQVDINNIERIEIIEGPASVIYGTDALAGVVNIITKDNSGNTMSNLTVRVQEESVNTEYLLFNKKGKHNAHIGVNFGKEQWSLALHGSRNSFGGWRGNATGRRLDWQPKEQYLGGLDARLNAGVNKLQFQFNYTHEDLFTPGDYNTNYTYIDKHYFTNRFAQMLKHDLEISSQLKLSTAFSYQNYNRKTLTEKTDLRDNTTERTDSAGEQDKMGFSQMFLRSDLLIVVNPDWEILTGVEVHHDRGTGARIDKNSGITEYAFYFTSDIRVADWMHIRPGVRKSVHSIYKAPLAIPSLNLKFKITEMMDLRTAYAKGFRSPALRELYFSFFDANHSIRGNHNLKAETSDNYNMYLTHRMDGNEKVKFYYTLGGFYNRYKNLISIGMDPSDQSINTYMNLNRYRTIGASLENNLIYKNFRASVGLSYIGRYNQLKDSHASLGMFSWTPEVNGSLMFDIRKLDLEANVFLKYNGRRPNYILRNVNGENVPEETSISSYTQLDLTFDKKVYRYLNLQAGVKNLLNITNVKNTMGVSQGAHSNGTGQVPVGYGRSYFLGLLFNLSK